MLIFDIPANINLLRPALKSIIASLFVHPLTGRQRHLEAANARKKQVEIAAYAEQMYISIPLPATQRQLQIVFQQLALTDSKDWNGS
ncbi:MAG: hypothetical protein LZF61_11200 [Nitrosomonas sp.]|nr:MAG: hypothetical protein LZF61_11200 [Nitrosomonas sp.]